MEMSIPTVLATTNSIPPFITPQLSAPIFLIRAYLNVPKYLRTQPNGAK